jgi:hypothetical protein
MRAPATRSLCLLALSCGLAGTAARAQDAPPKDRKIKVVNNTTPQVSVTVTLSQDGKAVRTQDVPVAGTHTFGDLRRGHYEVRMEAPDAAVVIKRVALFDEDTTLQLELPRGTGTFVLGAGPSVAELEARIKALEDALKGARPK